MFARSAKLSNKIRDLYLEFWKLDEFPYADTGRVDFRTAAPSGFYYAKSPVKPSKPRAMPAKQHRTARRTP